MAAKRALIVDDSRSARLILERILQRYEIDVDSAESAEAAIAYLTSTRPDVIFMDHLMPGMDGFQAVQAIKNNPLTATIPIMMYTSQEGELYLGQARALGAVGVLPKQIKPADVSKVLYQLHLVEERRLADVTVDPEPSVDQVGPASSKPLTEGTLREHFADLRRALIASIDTQTERIAGQLRAVLQEGMPGSSSSSQAPGAGLYQNLPWGWITAGVAIALALGVGGMWVMDVKRLAAARAEVAQLQLRTAQGAAVTAESAARETPPSGARSEPGAASPRSAPARRPEVTPELLKPLILPFAYGGDAMGSGHLDQIRQFLYRLARDGVEGVVDIRTFAGRYCLVGNATDGYSLAPDEMPYSKCDVVGNPIDDALSSVQRTPVALANLVGEIRHSTRGALEVQLSVGDPSVTLVAYPFVTSDLTAGEWNHAAGPNNRVEVRVRAR